jgi:hypothetical protein
MLHLTPSFPSSRTSYRHPESALARVLVEAEQALGAEEYEFEWNSLGAKKVEREKKHEEGQIHHESCDINGFH